MTLRKQSRAPISALPTLLLLALTTGAGAATWEAWNLTIDTSPAASEVTPGAAVVTAKPAPAAILETASIAPGYAETISRPLFNPTRRPIAQAAPKSLEAPPPVPVAPLQAQLVGLTSSASNGARALLRPANEKQASWLAVGEELRGWRVAEIKSDRVVMQSGEARQELQLVTPRVRPPKSR